MSKPIPIKYNTRNPTRIETSEKSGVHRVKVTPNRRLNHSISSSVKNMNSSQFINPSIQNIGSIEEKVHHDDEFEIKPTIKKTCARCKESNRCVKLLCSKINRIEELINGIAKSTENGVINLNNDNNNNNTVIEQQPPSPIPQIFLTQPSQLLTPAPSPIQNFSILSNPMENTLTSVNDYSNHSLEDLQKFVSIITNTMISNKGSCVPVVRPNALHMFNH
ncbi:hypothetical protein C1645_824140 [Glomus cerebriforme]|uniref:Uncharacterized protein n=1 Tax=Glomus cerebriforme TaxID=658196 RepID=A0A397T433_9GLOM|nr:hypothetical protein C1645_824140 [Glomus cerebriforme]